LNAVVRKVGKKGLGAIARRLTELTSLHLTDRGRATATKDVADFLERLTAPRLRFLNLTMSLDDRAVLRLERNTTLSGLTALEVWSSAPLSDTAITFLLESPNLQRLQRLVVHSYVGFELDVRKFRHLVADRKIMPELRQLDLGEVAYTAEGIRRARKIQESLKAARPGLDVR
jgi:hypothetical protein